MTQISKILESIDNELKEFKIAYHEPETSEYIGDTEYYIYKVPVKIPVEYVDDLLNNRFNQITGTPQIIAKLDSIDLYDGEDNHIENIM